MLHTTTMKVVVIILLIIILLLILPIKVKVHFYYNIAKNRGLILISLWNINVLFYRIKVKGLKIIIKNKKQTKSLDIDINTPNLDFANELQKQILKTIYLSNITLFSTFGYKDNACTTALVAGFLKTVFAIIQGVVKNQKNECEVECNSFVQFDKDKIVLTLKSVFYITLFDVLYSLAKAKVIINRKRRIKNGKQLSSN